MQFVFLLSREFRNRLVSALILAPTVLWIAYYGEWIFSLLVLSVAVLMAFEWQKMVNHREPRDFWMLFGLGYILIPCASFIWLRDFAPSVEQPFNGRTIVFWIILVVWATDIGAYFAGRTIGGPKLAPSISPGKTWAGLAGGVASAMAVGMLTGFILSIDVLPITLWSAFFAVIGQIGDLAESKLKRHLGIKDSGALIPGHGGLFDRLDALLVVAPLLALLLAIKGTDLFLW